MTKLNRTAAGAEIVQGAFRVGFLKDYGATPLEWTISGVPVVHRHAGAGAQVWWDQGQDPTAAGADGISFYPVPGVDGYYASEEAFLPDRDGEECLYQVGGPAPYFWISHEWNDDAIPNDPRGPHGWSTLYHDILNLGPVAYTQFGTPIFFVSKPGVTSGILMMGNQAKKDPGIFWNDRLCETRNGHIAFKMNLSLKDASSDGIMGVFFRKAVPMGPGQDINSAYAALGCSLLVNKFGGVDFNDGVKTTHLVLNNNPLVQAAVNSDAGLLVEVRSYPGTAALNIYVNGTCLGTFQSASGSGAHFGLYASAISGKAKFAYRTVFDMGSRYSSGMRSTSRSTVWWQNSLSRVRNPFAIPMYVTSLPGVFADAGIKEQVKIFKHDNSLMTPADLASYPGSFPFARDVKAAWVGRNDGTAGIFCRVHGFAGDPEAHMGISLTGIFLNLLPYTANATPKPLTAVSSITEWAPSLRMDLLD